MRANLRKWRCRKAGCALLGIFLLWAAASCTAQGRDTSSKANEEVDQSAAKSNDEATALTAQLDMLTKEKNSEADTIAATVFGPAGVVPVTKGFNFSLTSNSEHDSAGGWVSVLSPTLAFRFDQHFSLNASVSEFPYINAVVTKTTKNSKGVVTKTVSDIEAHHLLLGDTSVSAGLDLHSRPLDYNLTGTMGIPTGDNADGLGAGQFTYVVVNHFEHSLGDYLTPNLELGLDDSPNLLTPRVKKTYLVVGTNAHFEVGVDLSLPWHDIDFETAAYEELPIGENTVYSTTTKGKKGKQITTVTAYSAGEDNGFTNTLDIPLNPFFTLSGFYNRSLRNHDDTVGFSITYLLRGPKRRVEQATTK